MFIIWKNNVFSFLLIFSFILSGCLAKEKIIEKKSDKPVVTIDIDKLIHMNRDSGVRAKLSGFKDGIQTRNDHLSVSEYTEYYEIIISHKSYLSPAGKNYSGGAEQHLLFKKTGELRMGWHEHPNALPD